MLQYLKQGRQPVWVGKYPQSGDPQAAVPVAWCPVCGREIFHPGDPMCDSCQEKEEKQCLS